MTDRIAPAIPAEAWAGPYPSWRMATRTDEAGFDLKGGVLNITASDLTHPSRVLTLHLAERDARHALAALALWQQPFGFTREDIAALEESRYRAQMAADNLGADFGADYPTAVAHQTRAHALRSLAFRIEALLPPPPKEPNT